MHAQFFAPRRHLYSHSCAIRATEGILACVSTRKALAPVFQTGVERKSRHAARVAGDGPQETNAVSNSISSPCPDATVARYAGSTVVRPANPG
jgi:hypothetical protein